MSLEGSQPKNHDESGYRNSHKSQEGKEPKCNIIWTTSRHNQIFWVHNATQWITKQEKNENKQSKQATKTHLKSRLKTKGVTKRTQTKIRLKNKD